MINMRGRCSAVAAVLAAVLLGPAFAGAPMMEETPASVPEWRGVAPGTAWLGEDVLWRPRDILVFHMLDEDGGGFGLDFTVRDMNIYRQGPRPVLFWVVGPLGETLARVKMPDDGIVSGNERYRDGVYDVFQDARYREWHRVHSPGGYPPGKERSPHLERPQDLPYRRLSIDVPAAGAGLYRVVVMGCWDHWVSITPDRPIPTGIHPGPGPLAVHGDRLEEAYLYVPPGVQDLGASMVEEVEPYNWRVQLEDLDGRLLAETVPRTFLNFFVHTPERGDIVLRLRAAGETAGAHLHVQGVPFVLCPDEETARRIQGGVQVDEHGRHTFHHFQRVILEWAYGLSEEDLAVPAAPEDPAQIADGDMREFLPTVPDLAAEQDLDPASPAFGNLPRAAHARLSRAAAYDDPANPYYRHPAIVRRVLLTQLQGMGRFSPCFWDIYTNDLPGAISIRRDHLMSVPFRTNWVSFGRDFGPVASPLRDIAAEALPAEVHGAWKDWLNTRVYGRWMIRVDEIVNQWLYNLTHHMRIYEFTGNPEIPALVERHLDIILSKGEMGRLNPDPTPYRSAYGYGRPADLGWTGAGYLAEALGFDSAYAAWCQENNLVRLWNLGIEHPGMVEYMSEYNVLKTHLSLPRHGRHTVNRWREITSPNEFNFRTSNQLLPGTRGAFRELILYGMIASEENAEDPQIVWPALEEEPFVRVMDNKFFFVNTGAYYGVNYGGQTKPDWFQFTAAEVADGSGRLLGYARSRADRGRSSTKIGGIAALFVRNCGPVMLSQNEDVMYANTVWGRRHDPAFEAWQEPHVDPTVVSSGYVDAHVEFFPESRIYRRSGTFTYAPLHFARTIHYRDDMVLVDLELMATSDLDLAELYEAIPYKVDNRAVRTFGDGFEETGRFDPLADGEDGSLSFRAVELAAPGGAGATFVFDRTHRVEHASVFRYRAVAAATRSFNLALPNTLAAGERARLRYAIVPHQEPLTREQMEEAAASLK